MEPGKEGEGVVKSQAIILPASVREREREERSEMNQGRTYPRRQGVSSANWQTGRRAESIRHDIRPWIAHSLRFEGWRRKDG